MPNKALRYLDALNGNARVCVLCHSFWSVPFMLHYSFLSLYLKESGVTEPQIGSLMMAGTVASVLFAMMAAPLVDKMGRKRATLVFDLLSSALPPLLYFISGSYWMAMLATVLYNTNKIMSVGYYLVMIEDADDAQRLVAFNLFNIITYAAGLLIPLAGLWVARYGVTAVEKVLLLASFLIMTAMIMLRDRLLVETRVGHNRMQRTQGKRSCNFFDSLVRPYADSHRFLSGQRKALYIMLANVFFFAYMMLGTNQSLYFALFFSNRFNLGSETYSLLGGLYSAGMLLAMLFVNPFIQPEKLYKSLGYGSIVMLAGMAMLLVFPLDAGAWLVLPALLLSLSFGTMKTGLDSALAILTEGEVRSGLYSLTNLLSALLGITATAVVSSRFTQNPVVLFSTCLVLGLGASLLIVLAWRESALKRFD